MEKQFSLLIPFTSVCGMLSAKNCTQINPNLINFMLKRNVFEILSTTAFLLSAFIVSLFIFSLMLEFKFEKIQVKLKYLYHEQTLNRQLEWRCDAKLSNNNIASVCEDQEIKLFTWLC